MYSEVDRLFKTNMEGLTTKLNDLKEVNLEEKK